MPLGAGPGTLSARRPSTSSTSHRRLRSPRRRRRRRAWRCSREQADEWMFTRADHVNPSGLVDERMRATEQAGDTSRATTATCQSRTIPGSKLACHAYSASSAASSRSRGTYLASTLSMPSTRPRTRSIEMASTSAAWRRIRNARSWAERKLTTTSLASARYAPPAVANNRGSSG